MDVEQVPPPVAMVQLLAGFQVSQALYVVAKLGVPDALAGGPLTVDDLAAATAADPSALGRLVRTLGSLGLFSTADDGRISLLPLGATLATGTSGSVRDLAIMWMETHYGPFGDLLHTARTGEPAASHHYGRPFFDWLAGDPEQVARFTGAMAGLTNGIKLGAVPAVDFDDAGLVVDVGGADGTLLAHVLAAHPAARGVVFDLPHVVPAVAKVAAELGVADRVDAVGGDFFDSVPAGDGYLLSMVLHDWDDASATRILDAVRVAGGPGCRLRVMDFVVPAGGGPHMSLMIDLTMLGMLPGRERSAAEWSALFDGAGWRLDRVVETPTPISVIEATPAR